MKTFCEELAPCTAQRKHVKPFVLHTTPCGASSAGGGLGQGLTQEQGDRSWLPSLPDTGLNCLTEVHGAGCLGARETPMAAHVVCLHVLHAAMQCLQLANHVCCGRQRLWSKPLDSFVFCVLHYAFWTAGPKCLVFFWVKLAPKMQPPQTPGAAIGGYAWRIKCHRITIWGCAENRPGTPKSQS